MKSTIKTSRTAGQLEKMFRELNKHYYIYSETLLIFIRCIGGFAF